MVTFSEGKKQSMLMVCKLSKQCLLNYADDLEDNSPYCCAQLTGHQQHLVRRSRRGSLVNYSKAQAIWAVVIKPQIINSSR